MSKKHTSRQSKDKTKWDEFDDLTDKEVHSGIVDDPDAQPTDADFWKKARVVMPERKETITIRLDPDVLDWYRKQGSGYQTRINAVLRAYMQAHRHQS